MTEFEGGVFLIDKPVGPSSFTMVRKVRQILGMKKVGHAGTLDPFASGLLIVCAGRPATRIISQLMEGEKEYLATLKLGVQTTTQDPEGEIVAEQVVQDLSDEIISECLESFKGIQEQVPPAFSAVKYKGKPLYYYARKGVPIKKAARQIDIREIERLDNGQLGGLNNELNIRVVCSKGTYIRTLAADIGSKLGCGAHLCQLRRIRSGIFTLEKSFSGEDFASENAHSKLLAGALSVNYVSKLLQ